MTGERLDPKSRARLRRFLEELQLTRLPPDFRAGSRHRPGGATALPPGPSVLW